MSSDAYTMTCPLCGFQTVLEYDILLHMEERHPEGTSPFVADPQAGSGNGNQGMSSDVTDETSVMQCPIEGCGRRFSLAELEDHVEFHAMEDIEASGSEKRKSQDDAGFDDEDAIHFVECPIEGCFEQVSLPRLEAHVDRHATSSIPTHEGAAVAAVAMAHDASGVAYQSPYSASKDADAGSKGGHGSVTQAPTTSKSKSAIGNFRLGRSELGKHAYENKMPESLVAMLKKGKYTSAEGIVPVLARLLEQSTSTEYAYLCHPAVQHISKLRGEGGFCGYRNIQMLSSYIVGNHADGYDKFGGAIPSIFQIQDFIENAWDMGINATGRVETGGIKGTRKYIGTPEAQAMFQSLSIPCDVEDFKSKAKGVSETALLASILKYFESVPYNPKDKIRRTHLPPIYFQHRGHSLTIVGLERRLSGSLKLLVFDPMYHDPREVTRLVGGSATDEERNHHHHKFRNPILRHPNSSLDLYRRGNKYLRRFHEFEILKLRAKAP